MSRGVPPLLPWQPCLLAAIAGILALRFPAAAGTGLGLLALFPRPAPGRPRLIALVAAFGLGLGLAWWRLPAPPPTVPTCVRDGQRLTVCGQVDSAEARPEGRVSCVLTDVTVTDPEGARESFPGPLGLTLDAVPFRTVSGDILRFDGTIHTTRGFSNPGVADFAFLRQLDGIFYRTYARGNKSGLTLVAASTDSLARERERLRGQTEAVLTPPPRADAATRAGRAMVAALIYGELADFSTHDLDLVRRASLTHTLALSGMNISYVAALGFALIWLVGTVRPSLYLRLPRPYLALCATAPLVVGYCWLGGYSPSLYRAVWMFVGCGLLLFFGRHIPLFDALFLALAIMLTISPLSAYDARLQLSALAVAGIGLFWSPFLALSAKIRLPGWLRVPTLALLGILWTSLCAEAAVLPLIVRLFGEWNFNPWINVPWLPLLGFVVTPMALVGQILLPSPFVSGLGTALLLGAAWFCEGLMRVLAFLDARGLLVSVAVLRPSWPELLGYYGLLACLALVAAGRKRPLAALAASLLLLIGPTIARPLIASQNTVSLTVLDVGQGQSVVVGLPGGRRLLVDGGGLIGEYDVGRAVVGAFLTDDAPPRLTAVMASHPHADHVKGLVSILQRFAVAAYYDNGGTPEGTLALPVSEALVKRHIWHTALAAGEQWDLGQGLALDVVHPGPADDLSGNNGSLVLRLTWNGRGLAVIPGDAERGVLHRLSDSGIALGADVLVLPHHGSSSSLSRTFHESVAPKLAIASCGTGRWYPSPKVVESLGNLGCPVYATRFNGAVTVRFAGPEAPPELETTVAAPPVALTSDSSPDQPARRRTSARRHLPDSGPGQPHSPAANDASSPAARPE